MVTSGIRPAAACSTTGTRCVSGSWRSRQRAVAPAALKYLKLIERRPYAAEYQRSAFSKASLVSP